MMYRFIDWFVSIGKEIILGRRNKSKEVLYFESAVQCDVSEAL